MDGEHDVLVCTTEINFTNTTENLVGSSKFLLQARQSGRIEGRELQLYSIQLYMFVLLCAEKPSPVIGGSHPVQLG